MTGPRVRVVRPYDDPGRQADEYRVLADRLWPRGLRKTDVDHDEWAKDVAPSADLRRWYGHRPERFGEFARRYRDELGASPAREIVARLSELARSRPLVLLTATRDVPVSGAAVLAEVIEEAAR
jgi:uncharacterized protein YeaO (DUF488 family)